MARMLVATVFLLIALLSVQVSATTINLTSCGLELNDSQDLTVNLENDMEVGGTAYGTCIEVLGNAVNLTVDCKGHEVNVTGADWAFMEFRGSIDGLTVRNCIMRDYVGGMFINQGYTGGSNVTGTILIENVTANPSGDGFVWLNTGADGVYLNNPITIIRDSHINITGAASYLFGAGNAGAVDQITVKVYNNIITLPDTINNFFNLLNVDATVDLNTTSIASTNIVGGSTSGGNYWTNPSGTGFSDTCTNVGDFCDTSYNVSAYAYLATATLSGGVDYLPIKNPPQTDFNVSACQNWSDMQTVNVALTGDIVVPTDYPLDACLYFERVGNVNVDCQGHSIVFDGAYDVAWTSIFTYNRNPQFVAVGNVTVENCVVDFSNVESGVMGMYFEDVNGSVTLRNNTFTLNFGVVGGDEGVNVYNALGSVIVENNIFNVPYKHFALWGPGEVIVRGNVFNGEGSALQFNPVGPHYIYNNIMNGTIFEGLGGAPPMVWFNTTATAGTNIAGGSQIGGNLWKNSTGGYSETCTSSGSFCSTAYNIFGDGSLYDYLPLIAQCIPSWTCGAYNDLMCQYGTTQTCYIANDTNNCGVPYNGTFQEFGTQVCPIAASEFVGQGATTDFTNGTVFTQPVIEVPSVATIQWLGSNLNFTGANLDAHVDIGAGYISVDSIYLPDDLNTPAELTIVVPALQVPQVYRDGEKCGVCTNFSYDGTTATFVVPGFSNYSVGEKFTYYKEDLQPIVVDGLGITGAEIVSWLDLIVLTLVLVAIAGIVLKFSKRT